MTLRIDCAGNVYSGVARREHIKYPNAWLHVVSFETIGGKASLRGRTEDFRELAQWILACVSAEEAGSGQGETSGFNRMEEMIQDVAGRPVVLSSEQWNGLVALMRAIAVAAVKQNSFGPGVAEERKQAGRCEANVRKLFVRDEPLDKKEDTPVKPA